MTRRRGGRTGGCLEQHQPVRCAPVPFRRDPHPVLRFGPGWGASRVRHLRRDRPRSPATAGRCLHRTPGERGGSFPAFLETGSNGRAPAVWSLPAARRTPGGAQVRVFSAPLAEGRCSRARLSDPAAVGVGF